MLLLTRLLLLWFSCVLTVRRDAAAQQRSLFFPRVFQIVRHWQILLEGALE